MTSDSESNPSELADAAPLVGFATPASGPGKKTDEVVRGSTIGRYLVIDKVGQGGMGVVVRAYDPKLHREVALKRLHRGALDPEGEARLVREAQAMAQLNHPNITTIFDVERTDEGVVMAMEFLEGRTLSTWLDEEKPGWQEVVTRLAQAGEGLLAAHRAGLVHRDFKPGNAIIGSTGHVKVMDFGIARVTPMGTEAEPTREETTADLYSSVELDDDAITREGVVMGTPPYMAPEQHRGEPADARSDQYSFCVSLWEALWGSRPFRGVPRAMAILKHEGPPSIPRDNKAPRAVVDAIVRGLAPKPAQRWPSMQPLLDVLRREANAQPHRWKRRGIAAVAGMGVVAAVVAWPKGAADNLCTEAAVHMDEVWGTTQREAVHDALTGTGLSYAETTWDRVASRLDRYRESWIAMHTEACEATAVAHTQSEALLDLRMHCLNRRKVYMGAAVEVLQSADASITRSAINQVRELPPIEPCGDIYALRATVPPPEKPEVAAAVEQIRDEIAAALAHAKAGQIEVSDAKLEALIDRANGLDYPAIEAEVLSAASDVADLRGDAEQALAYGERSYMLALQVGDDQTAAMMATVLTTIIGARQTKLEAANAWAATAQALALRVDPQGLTHARVLNALAILAYRRGDNEAAIVDLTRSLELLEKVGPHSRLIADVLNHLGAMLDEQGRYTDAEPYFRRALAMERETFGDDHPFSTLAMDNLALCLQAQGRHAEARALHESTVEIRERSLGRRHPQTALAYNNLGWDDMADDDPETAAKRFAIALEIFEQVTGPEHPRVAMAAESLALARLKLGALDDSERLHERALKIRRAALGEEHPNVALSLNGLGEVATKRGDLDRAIELFEQARAIADRPTGGSDRVLAETLASLGSALIEAQRHDEAIAPLERALKLRQGSGADPAVVSRIRFDLGRALALRSTSDDPNATLARALDLIATAQRDIQSVDGSDAEQLRTEIDDWLAKHPVAHDFTP